MINQTNNKCFNLNDIWICGLICSIAKASCSSQNCNECEVCGDDWFCKSCKTNYEMAEDKKSCHKKEANTSGQKICHQNCRDCSDSFKNGNMNCISCQNNFYKLNGTNNCYDSALITERLYLKNGIYYPCDESCLTCSDGKNVTSNNCLTCENKEGLYLLEDKNNCEYSNFSGYYLHSDSKTLKKCYRSCKTCNGPYEINNENHNCIECADNYYKLPNGSYPNNCYDNDTIISWNNIEETILNINNISPSMIMNEISSNKMEETIKDNEYSTNNINNIYNEVETTSNKFKTSYYDTGTIINSEEKTTYKLESTSYNKETTDYKIETTTYK